MEERMNRRRQESTAPITFYVRPKYNGLYKANDRVELVNKRGIFEMALPLEQGIWLMDWDTLAVSIIPASRRVFRVELFRRIFGGSKNPGQVLMELSPDDPLAPEITVRGYWRKEKKEGDDNPKL